MIDFWSGLGVGLLALLGGAVIAREQIKAARHDAELARAESKLARENEEREHARARRQDLRDEAASILETMSNELEGMAREFRANRVPYSYGHGFKTSIETYKAVLRPFMVRSFDQELQRVEALASRAAQLDAGMEAAANFSEAPDHLAADCERAAGDLRGRAIAIRAGVSQQYGVARTKSG